MVFLMVPRLISNPNAEDCPYRVSITFVDNVADSMVELVTSFVARILLPEILAFFESEEGQREYAEWKAQNKEPKDN